MSNNHFLNPAHIHIHTVYIKTDHVPSTKIIQANSDSNKESSFLSSRYEMCSIPQDLLYTPLPKYYSVLCIITIL